MQLGNCLSYLISRPSFLKLSKKKAPVWEDRKTLSNICAYCVLIDFNSKSSSCSRHVVEIVFYKKNYIFAYLSNLHISSKNIINCPPAKKNVITYHRSAESDDLELPSPLRPP